MNNSIILITTWIVQRYGNAFSRDKEIEGKQTTWLVRKTSGGCYYDTRFRLVLFQYSKSQWHCSESEQRRMRLWQECTQEKMFSSTA